MPVYRYERVSENNSEHAFNQQLCSCNFHVHVFRAEGWDANHRLFHMPIEAIGQRHHFLARVSAVLRQGPLLVHSMIR
jgi:hypothetical protein